MVEPSVFETGINKAGINKAGIIETMIRDRSGVAALEIGLLAPVLMLLMLGGYDLTVWVRSAYRLNEAAANMGQVISQCPSINDPADINRFDSNAQVIAGKTDISSQAGGAFIITAVGYNASNAQIVLWQRRSGNPAFGSKIGAAGAAATLGAYAVPAGGVVIATELYAPVQPWVFSKAFMPTAALPALYASAVFLGRSAGSAGLATLANSATTLACAS